MAEGKTKKLLKETGWFAIGNFGSKLFTLLLVPLYTNVLTTGEYGIIDIITTTISLLVPVLSLSMAEGVLRFALDKDYDSGHVATSCLLVTAFSSVVLLLLYPVIRFALPDIMQYWWLFYFAFCFNCLSQVLASFMKAIDKSYIYAIQGILYTFVFASCNILFLIGFGMRIEGYLLSMVCASLITCIYIFIAGGVGKYLSAAYLDFPLLRTIVGYTVPLVPSSVAWWVMSSIDRYMLLYMCGADANGLYGIAHKIPSVIAVLTGFFLSAWQVFAIRNRYDRDTEAYTARIYKVLFLAGTMLCFAMIMSSELIGRIMFAKEFFPAWKVTPILAIATIFSTFSVFVGAQFSANMRSDLHFKSNVITMILNVILNYIFISKLGVSGAAYGTMISYFINLIYRHIKLKELMKIDIEPLKMYSACLLLMAAAVLVSNDIPYYIVACVILFAAVFILYRRDYMEIFAALKSRIPFGKRG
jgi:O-antigen/teichoic acid export membrane protein